MPDPRRALVAALVLAVPVVCLGQDVIPSPEHAAERHADEARPASGEPASAFPVHGWELPTIEVRGQSASPLREEDRVGSYQQPRWTAVRRFPTTRVYVIPAGTFEFEWWNRWQAPIDNIVGSCSVDPDTGASSCVGRKLRTQYEFEMGLGHRLQLDLYLSTVQDGPTAPMAIEGQKVELRWALADWGVIPGNPTLYLEWARHSSDVDSIEGKVLLGGQVAVGWHWGLNLVFEAGLGGADVREYAVAGGLSRTVCDEVFSVGLEAKVALSNDEDTDFGHTTAGLGGPSLSWAPIPPVHLLFTPLFGVEAEDGETSGIFEGWLIAGWTI